MKCELKCGETCCGCHVGFESTPYINGKPTYGWQCMKCKAPAPEHHYPCDPLSHIYNGWGHTEYMGGCFSCGLRRENW